MTADNCARYMKHNSKIIDILSKPSEFTFIHPRKQYFSFPPDVISHILNQPKSADGLEKLYKTCKYFFAKRQILIIKNNCCFHAEWVYKPYGTEFNCNKRVLFWSTGELSMSRTCSSVRERIYRCNLKILKMSSAFLTLEQFNTVTSTSPITEFHLRNSYICYSDGTNVPIDIILQKLTTLSHVLYQNEKETLTPETLKKLNEIKLPYTLERVWMFLFKLDDKFDSALFCKFLVQICTPENKIYVSLERSNDAIIAKDIESHFKSSDGNEIFVKVDSFGK